MDQNQNRRADDRRPALPLRWGERFTLLLTGPNAGVVGAYGATWPGQPAEYERVNVCELPNSASAFPDRDPNKPAEEQGLFNKFIVMRTDGKDAPGEKHHDCAYFVLDLDHDRHAPAAMRAYAAACSETHPALAADLVAKFGKPKLDDSEQYRLQMAGISTAALGYWKEGDTIHPDYDTPALRDVARLYAKYDELFKFRESVRAMVRLLKNREWAEDLGATGDAADLQGAITELVGADVPRMPGDWKVTWDKFSPPDTIMLSSQKWGGCFLRPPEPHDIGLHALAYRLFSDFLNQAAAVAQPDAVDAALHDAVVHGAGAFRVHGDGSTERVELTQEQHRHYAELAAFPPNLQRDALYHEYALPGIKMAVSAAMPPGTARMVSGENSVLVTNIGEPKQDGEK